MWCSCLSPRRNARSFAASTASSSTRVTHVYNRISFKLKSNALEASPDRREAGGDTCSPTPLDGPDLLTAFCRSRPAGAFREQDRDSAGPASGRRVLSGSRTASTLRTAPSPRTPRTLALSRRSPASCLAGLLLTDPPPSVGGGGRMAPAVGLEPTTRGLTVRCSTN
jgi:hypothetical protein